MQAMKNIFSVFLHNNKHIFNATGRLLPESIFWLLLQRERFLADRGGRVFAVVIFDLNALDDRATSQDLLVDTIMARLRCSDAAGWIDQTRVGALLAHIRAEDARRVADEICLQLGFDTQNPPYKVYAYPAERPGAMSPDDELFVLHTRAASGDTQDSPPNLITDAARIYPLFTPEYPRWKRALDMLGASLLVILLLPLLAGTGLYINIISPGPVFFRQQRVGRAYRTFTCFKFRTMHAGSDTGVHADHVRNLMKNNAVLTKLDEQSDRRLIPMGRLIRAAGLDELPQLFNVLLGDMSLVGPRPCIRYESESYEHWQLRRFDTRPGLTGLWQVNGKNRTTFLDMMRFDARYARHPGFWSDLQILWRTLPMLIGQVRDARMPAGQKVAA